MVYLDVVLIFFIVFLGGHWASEATKTLRFPTLARKFSECKSALQPGPMAGDLGAQAQWVAFDMA